MRTGPRSISKLLATFAVVGCTGLLACSSSTEPGGGGNASILGILNLPALAPNRPFIVSVDTDTIFTNGTVRETTGTTGGTKIQEYLITDVPAGTYYVYAAVGVVSDLSGGPQVGDFYGFFGTGGTPAPNPNAAVPTSGQVSFNINLSVKKAGG